MCNGKTQLKQEDTNDTKKLQYNMYNTLFSSYFIDCNACVTAAVEDVVPGTRLLIRLLFPGIV